MAVDAFSRLRSIRLLPSIIVASGIIFVLASFRSFRHLSHQFPPLGLLRASRCINDNFHPRRPPALFNVTTSPLAKPGNRCEGSTNPDDVVIIVRTGANEIYDKLPTQLLTSLQCVQDLLIFSDLEQRFGTHQVHNALDSIAPEVKANNPDFDYYRKMQDFYQYGDKGSGKAAWNLDKYKFLPMMQKTWRMRPARQWYVFIEADTYLVLSNLLLWLARLDPTEALFLGSPAGFKGENFAHGGSGIVLSGTAMAKLLDQDGEVVARYDRLMRNEPFGDWMLMKALKEKGVPLQSRWPMIQGEEPCTIPFGPGSGTRQWCQPIITMHHVTPDERNRLWQFEQQRGDSKAPLLMRDIYQHVMGSDRPARRDDWDNLSDDVAFRAPGVEGDRQKAPESQSPVEQEAYLSLEHCGRACQEDERCFQWRYAEDRVCGFSYSYRLGKRKVGGDGARVVAGWDWERIGKDQDGNGCEGVGWLD